MTTNNRSRELLDPLAQRFENEAQVSGDVQGWGQFLDLPKRHMQTGLYGTAAGLIVRALAGRGHDSLTNRAANQLCSWWHNRLQDPHIGQRMVQTLRMAFVILALRMSTLPEARETRDEMERHLIACVLPSRMWGNFWISGDHHDQTPRVFPSAIALLSVALRRAPEEPLDPRLIAVAERLEERLVAEQLLPPHEVAAASAAILVVKGASVSRRARARMAQAAESHVSGLEEMGVYFFDFEHSVAGYHPYGRDYYIVPTRVLMAVAGFQAGAPSTLRLMAEATVDALVENLRRNDGAYRSEEGARLSTVDQAWVAILLDASGKAGSLPGWHSRLWYALVRQRRGNWFTETAWPVASIMLVAGGSTLAISVNRQASPPSLAIDVLATLANLLVGGLYGPKYIQRLLPGPK